MHTSNNKLFILSSPSLLNEQGSKDYKMKNLPTYTSFGVHLPVYIHIKYVLAEVPENFKMKQKTYSVIQKIKYQIYHIKYQTDPGIIYTHTYTYRSALTWIFYKYRSMLNQSSVNRGIRNQSYLILSFTVFLQDDYYTTNDII